MLIIEMVNFDFKYFIVRCYSTPDCYISSLQRTWWMGRVPSPRPTKPPRRSPPSPLPRRSRRVPRSSPPVPRSPPPVPRGSPPVPASDASTVPRDSSPPSSPRSALPIGPPCRGPSPSLPRQSVSPSNRVRCGRATTRPAPSWIDPERCPPCTHAAAAPPLPPR